MKKLSYIVSTLFIAFFFLFSINGKDVSASTLSDIPSGSSSEINYLLDLGIIKGYPGNKFMPNNQVTREEAATMIGRAFGLDGTQRATSFPDVGQGSYASGYIESAYQKGIITGYPNGTYGPRNPMTRGEMAYLLQKAFQLKEGSNVDFRDVNKTDPVYGPVDKIVTAGLANGISDGLFGPQMAVTREQFALFLARGLNEDFRVSYIGVPIDDAVVNVESWDVLNVRSGPSTDNSKVGSLKAGTHVDIYRYEGDWAYISAGAVTGYVNSYYLADPSSLSPSGKKIAIDPGHGGSDPGALGLAGLVEKELNLSVALKVESLLKQKGIEVFMTRRDDRYLGLDERVSLAVNANTDTFVSIHGNKYTTESANGTETFYSTASVRSEKSKQLATFIQNRLVPALGTRDRGVKAANLRVIYATPLPSALVELGFISNTSDASKLATEEYRNKAAEAIALGIQDYYNSVK